MSSVVAVGASDHLRRGAGAVVRISAECTFALSSSLPVHPFFGCAALRCSLSLSLGLCIVMSLLNLNPSCVINLCCLFCSFQQVPGSATGFLKIALFYGQTTWVLIRSAGVGWPIAIFGVLVQHFSSLAGFSVTALECVIPGIGIESVFGIYVAIPAVLVLLPFIIYLVGLIINRYRSQPLRLWRQRCVSMGLFLLYGTYFNITVKLLDMFGCTVADSNQMAYLNLYPWLACDWSSGTYRLLFSLSVLFTAVYVVGTPVLCLGLVYKNRRDLEEPNVATMLGFIYQSYRSECYYWELINVLRRVLLAALLAVVPFTHPEYSVLLVLAALQLSLILQHAYAPFHSKLENRLELASLYVLLISFVGAYVAQQGGLTGSFDPTGLLYAMIIINAFTIGLVLLVGSVFVVMAMGKAVARHYINAPAVKRLGDMGMRAQQLLQREEKYDTLHGEHCSSAAVLCAVFEDRFVLRLLSMMRVSQRILFGSVFYFELRIH